MLGRVNLEPRGGVDDVRERKRVRLGETEVREGLELIEDAFAREIPRSSMPAMSSPLRASMRSGLRLAPIARRSWSARAPDRPAASVAMRMSCS